jgi:hypothetical protein
MKKIILPLMILIPIALSAQVTERKVVLIKAGITSSNKYTLITRGYPRPGLTDPIQIEGTAREAAVLNAQIIAREKFVDGFDVITNGKDVKYTTGKGYVDVVYVITFPNIKNYLKK